jgi:hypothetical protein
MSAAGNQEVMNALDNFCFVAGSVAIGNGFVLHAGRLHPHPTHFGYRNGVNPHHPGPKSRLAT